MSISFALSARRTLFVAVLGLMLFATSTHSTVYGQETPTAAPATGDAGNDLRKYILGPEDQIQLSVMDAEGVDGKAYRIGANGEFKVPLIGYVPAAGLTIPELERDLTERFSKYIRKPQLTVTITEFRSQPVSVIGAVNTPGIQHLQGQKTLLEVLAMAGGLRADAGHTAKITRQVEQGTLPLPNPQADATGKFTMAEVMLRPLLAAENPEGNIVIRPHDVISVPKSEMVYVVGDVVRAGGFSLNEKERMTVLQVISLAGGLTATAKSKESRILRKSTDADRTEVAIDLKSILNGKSNDVPLRPDDILFVPSSTAKKVSMRTVEAVMQTLTGIAIWGTAAR